MSQSSTPQADTATDPPGPLVKICGVTQPEQAVAIAELGADLLGLNFWPQSKRHLPVKEAAAWHGRKLLPPRLRLVGVFVNPELEALVDAAAAAGLSYVQLHGDESPDFCAAAAEQGLKVIKAIQVRDAASLDAIAACPVADILLDAYHPGQRGGIGQTFPWELALEFKRRFPDCRLWLAGGLTPGNVGEAVAGVRPHAVDVAGGVEAGVPGVKELDKVRQFVTAARRH